jgi:AcrR family transcriptional regulator
MTTPSRGCTGTRPSLIVVSPEAAGADEKVDRQSRILEAVLRLLSRQGISGLNMRSVAREADVALGLVNYYYEDKVSLIRAALHRIERPIPSRRGWRRIRRRSSAGPGNGSATSRSSPRREATSRR